jgi:hypothetical protein
MTDRDVEFYYATATALREAHEPNTDSEPASERRVRPALRLVPQPLAKAPRDAAPY